MRCSPPPKPISRRTSDTGDRERAQRADAAAGSRRSRASAGKCVAISPERRADSGLSLAAAVEGVALMSVMVDRSRPQAAQPTAPLIASTRSIFSQEKPPSASGARPKWP